MATITDYGSLKSAIQTWTARTDSVMGNQVPLFVEMAEQRLARGFMPRGQTMQPGFKAFPRQGPDPEGQRLDLGSALSGAHPGAQSGL